MMNHELFKEAKLPAIDTGYITQALNSVKGQVVGQGLGSLEIAEIFNQALARDKISFESEWQESGHPDLAKHSLTRAYTVPDGSISIGYEGDFYQQFDDMSDREWNEFEQVIRMLVSHEMTHRNQIESIKDRHENDIGADYKIDKALNSFADDPEDKTKYLSNPHEVAAYARAAVEELRSVNYSDDDIRGILRSTERQKNNAADSHTFWTYLEYFGLGDAVYKKFLQAVSRVVGTGKTGAHRAPWDPPEELTSGDLVNKGCRWLYHGTSTEFIEEIRAHGLSAGDEGRLYMTIVPGIAWDEAAYTVRGEREPGAGGGRAIVVVDATKFDADWYSDPEYATDDSLQDAYWTDKNIPVHAIADVLTSPGAFGKYENKYASKTASLVDQTFYRGTEPGNAERISTGDSFWDSKLFVADKPEHARNYGRQIDEYKFAPSAKILVEGTREWIRVAGKWRKGESMHDWAVRSAQAAQAAGYDAVYFKLQGTIGTIVLNPKAITKTKTATHKVTPFDRHDFQDPNEGDPNAGEGTNTYSIMPEQQHGIYEDAPIKKLIKESAIEETSWRPTDLEEGIAPDQAVRVQIPISALAISQSALDRAGKDCLMGRGSQSSGPVRIFYNTDNHQFLVEDGMHRIFEALQKKQKSLPAELWSAGYSDTIANVHDPVKLAGAADYELSQCSYKTDNFGSKAPVIDALDKDGEFNVDEEKTAKMGPHDNASTQIQLPTSAAQKTMAAAMKIPDAELGKDGRENEPHVTIKYGVDEDQEALEEALAGQKPFTVTLGTLHVFPEKDGQVPVVARVHAAELEKLHDLVSNTIGSRVDDNEYFPHVTLAYVLPKFGAKYEDAEWLLGTTFTADSLVLSLAAGKRIPIHFEQSMARWNYASSKRSSAYQSTPASIDLGDGFTLSYKTHPMEREYGDSNTWVVTNPAYDYKVGEVLLHFYKDVPYPSIGTISFHQDHQRTGLGRKCIQALAKYYGGLTSDPQRNTNDRAKGMWRGIPGVEEVPSTHSSTGGKFFMLKGASFFFGTDAVGATEILEKGFDPGTFLTTSPDTAKWHAKRRMGETGQEPVVLQVELPENLEKKLQNDPLERREGFYLENEPIPAQYVKIAAAGDTERWIYDPKYGVFATSKEIPHTKLIELKMGKPMSFGRSYDSVHKGYAFFSETRMTVKLQTFQGRIVDNEVYNFYKKRFPEYAIEEAMAAYASAKRAIEGGLLYHGTSVGVAKKIVQEGMPFRPEKMRTTYWLAANEELAKHYGNIAARARGDKQYAIVRVDGFKVGYTPANLKALGKDDAITSQNVPVESILGYDVFDIDPEYAFKTAMKINVPESARDHFWVEPPEGHEEFWAFVWPVKAKVGDQITFLMDKKPVAEAVISRIERPGESQCERTGEYKNRWKVYWTPRSFKKLAVKSCVACISGGCIEHGTA